MPRASHPTYMALTRESRVVVNKLAAILRVADAMIRGHRRRAADIQFETPRRRADHLAAQRPRSAARRNARWKTKGDLFEDIFGVKIRLEEA